MTIGSALGRLALLTAAMALATVAVGWWGIPLAAALFAIIDRRDRTAIDAGIAAGLAWGALLLVAASRGEVRAVTRAIGGAVGVPEVGLFILAIVFPTVLAWSCAAVCGLVTSRFGTGAR